MNTGVMPTFSWADENLRVMNSFGRNRGPVTKGGGETPAAPAPATHQQRHPADAGHHHDARELSHHLDLAVPWALLGGLLPVVDVAQGGHADRVEQEGQPH